MSDKVNLYKIFFKTIVIFWILALSSDFLARKKITWINCYWPPTTNMAFNMAVDEIITIYVFDKKSLILKFYMFVQ